MYTLFKNEWNPLLNNLYLNCFKSIFFKDTNYKNMLITQTFELSNKCLKDFLFALVLSYLPPRLVMFIHYA